MIRDLLLNTVLVLTVLVLTFFLWGPVLLILGSFIRDIWMALTKDHNTAA